MLAHPVSAAPLAGLPAYRHVVLIVEENEGIDSTYGPSSPASYLKALSKVGAFADQYFGIGHGSLDNYIALLSGQPWTDQTGNDCIDINLYACAQLQGGVAGGRNLADQYDAAGVSWKGYMDGNTQPCQHADYSPGAGPDAWVGDGKTPSVAGVNYADRHNPFVYFPDIVGNDTRCREHVRPYSELSADMTADSVPQFAFITPDSCHDGHDSPCADGTPGGLQAADRWLKQELPALLSYLAAHQGLLLITTDEASSQDGGSCCTPNTFGGRVGLVALGEGVKAGKTVSTPYNHNSLLRTLESFFGISEHLNNAAGTVDMSDVFTPSYQVSQAHAEATLAAELAAASAALATSPVASGPSFPYLPAGAAALLVIGVISGTAAVLARRRTLRHRN